MPSSSRVSSSARGSLSPSNPAELIAPNSDYLDRPIRQSLTGDHHTSQQSHMRRAPFSHSSGINSFIQNYQRGWKPSAEDNRPDRFDTFLLGDGEKKVFEEADTRIPSSSIFTFNKEDHTLGNLLRSQLLKSPHVTFAGYKIPHPLDSVFLLRIQTDGSLTPRAALMQSCKEIVADLAILSREFTKEWELRKMVGDGAKADEKGEKGKGPGR